MALRHSPAYRKINRSKIVFLLVFFCIISVVFLLAMFLTINQVYASENVNSEMLIRRAP